MVRGRVPPTLRAAAQSRLSLARSISSSSMHPPTTSTMASGASASPTSRHSCAQHRPRVDGRRAGRVRSVALIAPPPHRSPPPTHLVHDRAPHHLCLVQHPPRDPAKGGGEGGHLESVRKCIPFQSKGAQRVHHVGRGDLAREAIHLWRWVGGGWVGVGGWDGWARGVGARGWGVCAQPTRSRGSKEACKCRRAANPQPNTHARTHARTHTRTLAF